MPDKIDERLLKDEKIELIYKTFYDKYAGKGLSPSEVLELHHSELWETINKAQLAKADLAYQLEKEAINNLEQSLRKLCIPMPYSFAQSIFYQLQGYFLSRVNAIHQQEKEEFVKKVDEIVKDFILPYSSRTSVTIKQDWQSLKEAYLK